MSSRESAINRWSRQPPIPPSPPPRRDGDGRTDLRHAICSQRGMSVGREEYNASVRAGSNQRRATIRWGGGRVVIAAFGVELIQREAVGMVVHVLVGIMFEQSGGATVRTTREPSSTGGRGDQFTICRYNLRHASPVTCLDLKHIMVVAVVVVVVARTPHSSSSSSSSSFFHHRAGGGGEALASDGGTRRHLGGSRSCSVDTTALS
jgi:hypothetical protein